MFPTNYERLTLYQEDNALKLEKASFTYMMGGIYSDLFIEVIKAVSTQMLTFLYLSLQSMAMALIFATKLEGAMIAASLREPLFSLAATVILLCKGGLIISPNFLSECFEKEDSPEVKEQWETLISERKKKCRHIKEAFKSDKEKKITLEGLTTNNFKEKIDENKVKLELFLEEVIALNKVNSEIKTYATIRVSRSHILQQNIRDTLFNITKEDDKYLSLQIHLTSILIEIEDQLTHTTLSNDPLANLMPNFSSYVKGELQLHTIISNKALPTKLIAILNRIETKQKTSSEIIFKEHSFLEKEEEKLKTIIISPLNKKLYTNKSEAQSIKWEFYMSRISQGSFWKDFLELCQSVMEKRGEQSSYKELDNQLTRITTYQNSIEETFTKILAQRKRAESLYKILDSAARLNMSVKSSIDYHLELLSIVWQPLTNYSEEDDISKGASKEHDQDLSKAPLLMDATNNAAPSNALSIKDIPLPKLQEALILFEKENIPTGTTLERVSYVDEMNEKKSLLDFIVTDYIRPLIKKLDAEYYAHKEALENLISNEEDFANIEEIMKKQFSQIEKDVSAFSQSVSTNVHLKIMEDLVIKIHDEEDNIDTIPLD